MNYWIIVTVILIIIIIVLIYTHVTTKNSYEEQIDSLEDTIDATNNEIEKALTTIKANTELINSTKQDLTDMTKEKNVCNNDLKEEKNEASRLEATITTKVNTIIKNNQEIMKSKDTIDKLTKNNTAQEESLVELKAENLDLYNPDVFKIYNTDVHKNTEIYSRGIIKEINHKLNEMHTSIKNLNDLSSKDSIKTAIKEKVIGRILEDLDRGSSRTAEFSYFTDCLLEFVKNTETHDPYIELVADIIWKIRDDVNFRIQPNEEETLGSIIERIIEIPGCVPVKSLIYYGMGAMTNKHKQWIFYPIICTIGKKVSIAILNEITKLSMFTEFPNLEQVKTNIVEDIQKLCDCSVDKATNDPYKEQVPVHIQHTVDGDFEIGN